MSAPLQTRQTTVYLAGPMTGYPEHNFPAFNDGAHQLRLAGYEVVSPAEQHPVGIAPYDTWTWEQFLRADLRIMLTTDVIVVLPGWDDSKGARLEVATGKAVGIYAITMDAALFTANLFAPLRAL